MSKLDAAVLISQAVFGIWVIRIFHKERRERKAESRRWFFAKHPDDAVRIDLVTEVNIVGDMIGVDLIDEAVSETPK